MSCCGDRRAQLAREGIRSLQSPTPAAPQPDEVGAALRYSGPVPMILRGPVSGAVYRMESVNELVPMAGSDVPAMLRTGWFSR
jgi:hypothetical protein